MRRTAVPRSLPAPTGAVLAVVVLAVAVLAGCTSGTGGSPPSSATASSRLAAAPSTTVAPPTSATTTAAPSASATPSRASVTPRPTSTTPRASSTRPATARPSSTAASQRSSATRQLPLGYRTADADQVVTVTASSRSDTQATLRTWQRVTGGWQQVGPSVPAWLGSDGMTSTPSETTSATPMGSFTLTQAFGHDSDPGTRLPYTHTTPADWWISQSGPLYNTLQHCSSNCAFTRGDPNEHLYYETPFYDYAVVINYNRSPVTQGAGSAFFLHVTVGEPTAGCVSIAQSQLVRILRWLRPAQHPRIMIGTV